MNGNKTFLDTNIIVYAFDSSAKRKHEIAKKIVIDQWDSRQGQLSTQVLQEFYVTVTQKIPKPLDRKLAIQTIKDLLHWDVVVNDGDAIIEAIDIQTRYKYSFWDAMIIQAAIKGGAELILSENLDSGRKIQGVALKNPFDNKS
jgi:predicted nucleic acid-binding protein